MNWRALVEAQWDIIDVSDHYDHLSAGLGNDFVIEARAAIHRVAAQPASMVWSIRECGAVRCGRPLSIGSPTA